MCLLGGEWRDCMCMGGGGESECVGGVESVWVGGEWRDCVCWGGG